jgi:E3 ubiquitin-protein ligase ZNF598
LINRIVMNNEKCTICKAPSKEMILSKSLKPYEEFKKEKLYLDKVWNIYLEYETLKKVLSELRDFSCKECEETKYFKDQEGVKKHVEKVHHKHFCNICLENRKIFPCDQKVYSKMELNNHVKYGETDEFGIINGHPECKFCKMRLYSIEELLKHMQLSHYQCDICREKKIHYEYYRDYEHLEEHFRSDHYLCENKICLEQRFVVFRNEVEMKSHEFQIHQKSKKIVLDIGFGEDEKEIDEKERRSRIPQIGQIDATSISKFK